MGCVCEWSCVSGQRPRHILLPDGKRQRGRTVQSQGSGRQTRRGGGAGRNQKRGLYLLWDLLLPPFPPTRPSLGAHRPPAHGGHREARAKGKRRGVWWFPQARPWAGPPHPPAASEQQGFLLEVVPLPEGQAVELFHAHPKHFSELLGRQVSLQMKRATHRGTVSNLARCSRRRDLQRGWWHLPGHTWLPRFPLHPHQSALRGTEAGPEERGMVRGPTVSSCQAGVRALTPDTCRSISHRRLSANQAWKW